MLIQLTPPHAAIPLAAEAGDHGVSELAACVQPLLAMLSAEDRAVLESVELAGESQTDLARRLKAPTSTVKSRVQRARQRLREHFERCCTIESDARGAPHDFTPGSDPAYPRCDGCSNEQINQKPHEEKKPDA